jgi:uncharacterized protein with GYD domain
MSEDPPFTRYVTLVDVDESNAQNVQELASLWGEIDNELANIGVEVEESFAVLGEVDFLVIFEAPSTDVAFQADTVLERHGLDVQTETVTSTDHFAELVGDL